MSFQVAHKWTVRFDDNLILVTVVDYRSLLVPWMKLFRIIDVSVYISPVMEYGVIRNEVAS